MSVGEDADRPDLDRPVAENVAGATEGGAEPVAATDELLADVDQSRLQGLALAGMAWSLFKQWGARAISIIVFTVLAHTLNPESFGVVALAAVFIGFLDIPLRTSLGDALVQSTELRMIQINSAFWALIGVSSILALAMAASAQLIASAAGEPALASIIAVMALGLPLTAISVVPQAILRRQMNYRSLAFRKLVAESVAGIVAVGLALSGAGAWALVVKFLASSVMLAALALRAVEWRPRLQFSWGDLRSIAIYGSWSTINSIVGFISRNADNLVIGGVLGSVALGYYSIAFQMLTIVVLLVTDTIESAAMSTFSRMQDDRAKVGTGFALGVRTSLMVLIAAAMITVALAPSVVSRWFGEQWLPSSDIVRVLILGSLIAPATSLSITVIKSMGRPDLAFRLALARTVASVVGIAFAVQFGILWVAVAQVVTLACVVPFYLRAVHRLCDVPWRALALSSFRLLVTGLVAGTVAILVAGQWADPVPSFWRLALAVAASVATLGAMFALLARREVNEVVALLKRQRSSAKA